MEKDSFLTKIEEIRTALGQKLYNCALALALTLPDICGKVESPDARGKGKSYRNWFQKYAAAAFTNIAECLPDGGTKEVTWLTAEECWKLRCSVLHAGNYDLDSGSYSVTLHAHIKGEENYSHVLRSGSLIDWDAIQICEILCNIAEKYYLDSDEKRLFSQDEVKILTW